VASDLALTELVALLRVAALAQALVVLLNLSPLVKERARACAG